MLYTAHVRLRSKVSHVLWRLARTLYTTAHILTIIRLYIERLLLSNKLIFEILQ
jgi:hypothetical protein